ncbi:MobV family relaxase [Sporolactobacillus terrae]|uniref:MobV family relaxase n=1 Tax=Sporolactobacillus terrae TaxID=269673 RepID=UPI000687D87E|nr:MobV family relaxase [Sporolactobacillus terrae]
MAFVVCHMTKYASGNLGGLQRHNQRETENHANKDIKTELSYLNYDLINTGKISYPKKINDRIAEGVETNRAIRKDAVRVCGFIVSASPELFKDKAENETRSYFEKATGFFKNRYGAENVVYAQVHMDETTPHMHLGVVPITEDHKLSAKRIFNRKELQNLQKNLPDYMQKQGFVVQKGQSKNKHLDELEYKAQRAEERAKQAQSQAAETEKILAEKQKSLVETKKTVDSLIATGGQKVEEAKKATKVLAQRAAQEIQLKAHHMELTQSAWTLSGKIEEATETLGELELTVSLEEEKLKSVRAAADKNKLFEYHIDNIPVEIKKSGILRNGPESVVLERKHWEELKHRPKQV